MRQGFIILCPASLINCSSSLLKYSERLAKETWWVKEKNWVSFPQRKMEEKTAEGGSESCGGGWSRSVVEKSLSDPQGGAGQWGLPCLPAGHRAGANATAQPNQLGMPPTRDQIHQLQHRVIKFAFKFPLEALPLQEAVPSVCNTFHEPISFPYDCGCMNGWNVSVMVLMISRPLEITALVLDPLAWLKLYSSLASSG